ncbi:TPA: glycosyltransferase family 1 protein [Candidatus Bathyarchaeota archaeon]|nr:glycosyltransferase family 1 protein [Candidatus Bathyarchaeota archaeon]
MEPIIPIPTILIPTVPAKIMELLRERDFDIVHAHHAFSPTSLLSIAAAKKLGIPAVLTNHTIPFANDARYFWTPMGLSLLFPFRRYITRADRVIAVSKAAADFIEHFVPRRKIVIIPNGIDIHRFDPINRHATIGNTAAVTEGKPIILYVGRLVHRKGVHVLVEAMPIVLKEFPGAQLLIVGDGYMRGLLKLLVKSLKLEASVKLLGLLPDDGLLKLYEVSDVFALPSLYGESFGVVLLEAMAAGKPIVASRAGGIPEIIKDNVTGILVKGGNKDDLANAILKILSDPDLAKLLARNGRKMVENKYSWSVVAEDIERVYRELVGCPAG